MHSKEFSLPPLKSELENQLPVPSCVLSITTAIQRVRITYVDVPEPMAGFLGRLARILQKAQNVILDGFGDSGPIPRVPRSSRSLKT